MQTKKMTLQKKIMLLVIVLLLVVITLLTSIFAYLQSKDRQKQAEQLALQTAKTISYMTPLKRTFKEEDSLDNLDADITQIMTQVDASAIYITDREQIVFASVNENAEEKAASISDKELSKTVVFGASTVAEASNENHTMIRGSAPIIIEYENYNQVVGGVYVDISKSQINKSIIRHLTTLGYLAVIVLLIGAMGAIVLARNIRKDTFGLEPQQIASLFYERNAILQAIKEGILAIDTSGTITMTNASAEELLELNEAPIHQHINNIMPDAGLTSVILQGKSKSNEEFRYREKTFILNSKLIQDKNKIHGVVVSFREKTELKKLIDTLTEVSKYSEDLRAQTHEFSNKLYVILGLLELGEYDEAIELIKNEYAFQIKQHDFLLQNIHSQKIQAILLGKLGKASEKKVHLVIDENSYLESLPEHLGISPFITIIGNLIDNSIEAVRLSETREVSFFITDIGRDIIIEVSDSGQGFSERHDDDIFKKGFSTKGEKRGYGLANVKEVVEEFKGFIEYSNLKNGGAVFTVYLPKERNRGILNAQRGHS